MAEFTNTNGEVDNYGGHRFATAAVHAGCDPDESGAVVPSICVSSTFVQSYPGVKPGMEDPNSHGGGYYYSRQANPTRGALERAMAVLEHGKHSCVFSSGLAASASIIQLLKTGDHVVALDDLYGGTVAYFRDIATPSNGIKFTFTDMSEPEKVEAAITPETKMIWLESPTNPSLKVTDVRAIAAVAKKHNCLLVVDGTFMSPYLQNALDLGADLVLHSVTKYLGGHSDLVMGVVITRSDDLIKRLRFIQCFAGAVPSAFDCYLTLRGLKTLHIRVEQSMRNAMALAEFLEQHPMIEKVNYPGLASFKYAEIHKKQSRGPGAMIAMYIKGGLPIAGKFLASLKVFSLAVSLGAVESLASSPAIMTHGAVPLEQRLAIGLTDNLIRLSIGIEHVDDLIEDMKQALDIAMEEHKATIGPI